MARSAQPEIRRSIEAAYTMHLAKEFGQLGIDSLKNLNQTLLEIFQYINADDIDWKFVILSEISPTAFAFTGTLIPKPASLRDLAPEQLRESFIYLNSQNEMMLVKNVNFDFSAAIPTALFYELDGRSEKFVIKGTDFPLPKYDHLSASIYCRATFTDLDEAIKNYGRDMVARSTCYLFKDAWFDDKRIFLKAKPEEKMRESLTQYLRAVYSRNADVQPEQNVNESKPIDIKVSWMPSGRTALIEIKWLGKSKNADGSDATPYSAGRAREGAKQLADYLDLFDTSAPNYDTFGYLVVMDARRKCSTTATTVTTSNGHHYECKDIPYDPKYEDQRTDFKPPIRLFAYPICN